MKKPVIKLNNVLSDCEIEFGKQLVKHFEDATSGDLDIGLSCNWSIINEEVIENWWRWNASEFYDLELPNGTILNEGDEVNNE